MMCAVCYLSGKPLLVKEAEMIVNGQSVCLLHVGVARVSTTIEEAVDNVHNYMTKKHEDKGFGDFASRLP